LKGVLLQKQHKQFSSHHRIVQTYHLFPVIYQSYLLAHLLKAINQGIASFAW